MIIIISIFIKFYLLMLGMKGATSDFSCIWCNIHIGTTPIIMALKQ